MVLTAFVLQMIDTAFEGGGLLDLVQISSSSFAASLLQYLLFTLTAALAVAIGVCALTLNFRNTDSKNWRWQSFQSTFALFVIDIITACDAQAIVSNMISTVASGPSKVLN